MREEEKSLNFKEASTRKQICTRVLPDSLESVGISFAALPHAARNQIPVELQDFQYYNMYTPSLAFEQLQSLTRVQSRLSNLCFQKRS